MSEPSKEAMAVADKIVGYEVRKGRSFIEAENLVNSIALALDKAREEERGKADDTLELDAIEATRRWAKEGLGFNCTFVDDDMRVIVGLAQRAVLAGLASDFSADMQKRFTAAAEKCREGHEGSLGFALTPRSA